jgi:hypothetical protein
MSLVPAHPHDCPPHTVRAPSDHKAPRERLPLNTHYVAAFDAEQRQAWQAQRYSPALMNQRGTITTAPPDTRTSNHTPPRITQDTHHTAHRPHVNHHRQPPLAQIIAISSTRTKAHRNRLDSDIERLYYHL